jgi:hypothetical protein
MAIIFTDYESGNDTLDVCEILIESAASGGDSFYDYENLKLNIADYALQNRVELKEEAIEITVRRVFCDL